MGILALTLSSAALIPIAAPFTPALFLYFITLPAAVTAIVLGSWRTGFLAVYWIASGIVVFPGVWNPPIGIEFLLMVLFGGGLTIGCALYIQYRSSSEVT